MTHLISIVTPCFNEVDNVDELVRRISAVMEQVPYDYEHIFIDNASTDGTVDRIKEIAARDRRVKLIRNARNFGHIRSPFYGLLQGRGDATIMMASDLQDPPELIPDFIAKWEEGYPIVLGVKPESDERWWKFRLRRIYYRLSTRISEVPLIQNATGSGLIDRKVVEVLRTIDDPYPYYRGLLAELGFPLATIPFRQPNRVAGKTKNNFYTLFDMAWLGITSHSRVPLRVTVIIGFISSVLSLLIAFGFLVAKLVFWDQFQLGIAPILIGVFFFGSVQLFSVGVLGEYVAAIHMQVKKRPLVVELERVNFD